MKCNHFAEARDAIFESRDIVESFRFHPHSFCYFKKNVSFTLNQWRNYGGGGGGGGLVGEKTRTKKELSYATALNVFYAALYTLLLSYKF